MSLTSSEAAGGQQTFFEEYELYIYIVAGVLIIIIAITVAIR